MGYLSYRSLFSFYSVFSLLPLVSFSSFTVCVLPSSISSFLLCLRYFYLCYRFSLFLFLFQIWLHWPYKFRHFDTVTQRFEGYGDWGNFSRCWGFKCKRYTVHLTVHELMGSNKSSLDN